MAEPLKMEMGSRAKPRLARGAHDRRRPLHKVVARARGGACRKAEGLEYHGLIFHVLELHRSVTRLLTKDLC